MGTREDIILNKMERVLIAFKFLTNYDDTYVITYEPRLDKFHVHLSFYNSPLFSSFKTSFMCNDKWAEEDFKDTVMLAFERRHDGN